VVSRVARTARRKAKQFRVSVRERGLLTTLYWAAFGFLKPNEFCLFVTTGRGGTPPAADPDVRYELWTAAQVREWREREGRGKLPPEFFQDTIDGVRACAVARLGDEVAGLIWVYDRHDPSRLFRLGPREFELNYGTVIATHRRHGLFTNILTYAARQLAARGARRIYAGVHVRNIASRRAFERAGFAPIGTLRQVAFYRPRRRAPATAA
jgi:RimJ/RimL family protein N-acetyltransferase